MKTDVLIDARFLGNGFQVLVGVGRVGGGDREGDLAVHGALRAGVAEGGRGVGHEHVDGDNGCADADVDDMTEERGGRWFKEKGSAEIVRKVRNRDMKEGDEARRP